MTVINPSSIGNPDETPAVSLDPAVVSLLNPCFGAAPSGAGVCGGVNGYHRFDCQWVPAGSDRTFGEP
jgi:hypothetical protein